MIDGKLAIVGCGNWGKNLVRNFCTLLGPEEVICCDQSNDVLQMLAVEYPGIAIASDAKQILEDSSVTAVVIATPAVTHYSLARQALEAGKHVLVEKPLTTSAAEASDLCDLADREKSVLMVDHLLLFHPAVQELERRIAAGDLGEIYHLYGRRTNLGVVRSEENALWSLGAHDVAVMLRLLAEIPVQVTAQGGAYLQPDIGVQDVVFVTLVFPGGQIGHLHLSWHDPRRMREITIVGSRKMVVFDDVEPTEKLRLYDRGIEFLPGDQGPSIQDRGVQALESASDEPLKLVCQHFLDSVERGHAFLSTGRAGLEVVRILEAAQASLEAGGAPVDMGPQPQQGNEPTARRGVVVNLD